MIEINSLYITDISISFSQFPIKMENSNQKRSSMPDNEVKILEPILVRLNRNGSAARDIHIDKSEVILYLLFIIL